LVVSAECTSVNVRQTDSHSHRPNAAAITAGMQAVRYTVAHQ